MIILIIRSHCIVNSGLYFITTTNTIQENKQISKSLERHLYRYYV